MAQNQPVLCHWRCGLFPLANKRTTTQSPMKSPGWLRSWSCTHYPPSPLFSKKTINHKTPADNAQANLKTATVVISNPKTKQNTNRIYIKNNLKCKRFSQKQTKLLCRFIVICIFCSKNKCSQSDNMTGSHRKEQKPPMVWSLYSRPSRTFGKFR